MKQETEGLSIPADTYGRKRWVAGLTVAAAIHAALLAFALKRGPFAPSSAAKSTEMVPALAEVAAPAVSETTPLRADAPVVESSPRITLNLAAPTVALTAPVAKVGFAPVQSHRRAPTVGGTAMGKPTQATEAAKLRHHTPVKGKGSKSRHPRSLHPHKRSRSPGPSTPSKHISQSLSDQPATPDDGADDRVLI
jgi:hypothetical protein